jgi:hypothetical protein
MIVFKKLNTWTTVSSGSRREWLDGGPIHSRRDVENGHLVQVPVTTS